MDEKMKKFLLVVFIFGMEFLSVIVVATVAVALFCLGISMMCNAFITDKTWYSAPLLIFGLCIFFFADWLSQTPLIPPFWRTFARNHRD